MRMLHFDPKEGRCRVQVEALDDLWHLSHLIEPGDTVRSSTQRREERRREDDVRGKKRVMTLTLCVERVEFQAFSERLRVSGRIIEGKDGVGRFHTFNLGPGTVFTLTKREWRPAHLRRLRDARTRLMRGVLFVCLDEDEAVIVRAFEYGVKPLAEVSSGRSGKRLEASSEDPYRERYHKEIWEVVSSNMMGSDSIVVMGPGFEKEHFASYLAARGVKSHVEHVSQSGLGGVHELLKKGARGEVIRELRVARESKLVEDLFQAIARDAPVAYGEADVLRALEMGAVEELLVHEKVLYDPKTDVYLRLGEDTGARLHIISMYHDAGRRFAHLGGIAALLRFRLDS